MKTVNDIVWDAIHTGKNAAPWLVFGSKSLAASGSSTNPAPSKVDSIGEITYLPYVVPQNHILVLNSVHLSTWTTCSREAYITLKLTRPNISAVEFYSIIKCSEHNEHHWHNGFWVPEGSSLQVDIGNSSSVTLVVRFHIDGILVNVSEAFKKRPNARHNS